MRPKNPLPLLFSYSFAMVGSGNSFRSPFLLVICSIGCGRRLGARKIIEIIFVPRLAEFLAGVSDVHNRCNFPSKTRY